MDFIHMVRTYLPDMPACMKYKVDIIGYKPSWDKTTGYHPKSKLTDELVAKIFEDAKNKVPQRKIAASS